MTMIGRRWMISFALALAAHTGAFFYAGSWIGTASRPRAPQVAAGDESMELMLVAEAPPAAVLSPPAAVSSPPEPPREEVRVEPAPPELPPEPVKTREPEPVAMPDPKPVLTERAPESPAAPPVAAPAKPVEREPAERKDGVDKVEGVEPMDEQKGEAPAAAAPGSGPVGVKGGSAPVSTIHPRYPMGSRIRGEEGPVLLRARVDDRGKPVEVTVLRSSGFNALDEAAEKAVKGARFVPPAPGSPPESYLAELTIRFQLKNP